MAQYILNMGGYDSGTRINTVDIFHVTASGVEKVTPSTPLTLSVARYDLAAASCGNYILAMGGYANNDGRRFDTVDVFEVTDTGIVNRTTDFNLTLSSGRSNLAAASFGNYILAMGGAGSSYLNTVDVFEVTNSGVVHRTDLNLTLSVGRYYLAAASCGNYILAMGGYAGGSYLNTVDVFEVTASGVVNRTTDFNLTLSSGRRSSAAASFGNYILAMGGAGGIGNVSNAVDVFEVTNSGVVHRTDLNLTLSVGRDHLAAASAGNFVLAMGGVSGTSSAPVDDTVVDVFEVTDSGVTRRTDLNLTLSEARGFLAAASCGNFVLAMGGSSNNHVVNTVDVFQLYE